MIDKLDMMAHCTHLKHIEAKWLVRIHPSKFQVCICKAELVPRCEAVNLIVPQAREQVRHWCVFSHNKRAFRDICNK